MRASELKKDDWFFLKDRIWRLVVTSTDYAQSINLLPDGSGASLSNSVIIAKNELGMLLIIPHYALVEKVQATEVIQFHPLVLVEMQKVANE